jgi:phosphate uptake regulator
MRREERTMAALMRWGGGDGVGNTHEVFITMLHQARQAVAVALAARLGQTDVAQALATVAALEADGDEAEMRLRRLLLVHASVHGADDIPSCLTYMSIGKDAERISDLALGLCQIAERIAPPAPREREDLAVLGQTVVTVLGRLAEVIANDDEDGARALIKEARSVQQACSARLDDVVRDESGDEVEVAAAMGVGGDATAADDGGPRQPVALALTYRHLGRIAANALNIASSIVVPLDRLDYPATIE